jgi:hypothetical protein
MDTQQVLELLLARMETMQVKADADWEERKADREKAEAYRIRDKDERRAAQVKADAD